MFDEKLFNEKLASFMLSAQKHIEEYHAVHFPSLTTPRLGADLGSRYIRIWLNNGTQVASWCFVDRRNGNVLKCASWKKPAPQPRGNIFSDKNGMEALGPGAAIRYL